MGLHGGEVKAANEASRKSRWQTVKDLAHVIGHPEDLPNGTSRQRAVINTLRNSFGSSKRDFFDAHSAGVAAAWNCALGELACDMAYCNYAYCVHPNGTLGKMGECPGFDPIRGMPL